MKQEYTAENDSDENGNPHGGWVGGLGFSIEWQRGPLAVDGERLAPSGAFVETIIDAAKQRIEFYQESKFACNENREAIIALEKALWWLNSRTQRRTEAGIEGTHEGN